MESKKDSAPNGKVLVQTTAQVTSNPPLNLNGRPRPVNEITFSRMAPATIVNRNSPSQRQNKDWKAALSSQICEKTGINAQFAESIQIQVDNYIHSNPKKFQAELLPISSLKVTLIQDTFLEFLPSFLMNELKSKLKFELERVRSYFEEKEDIDLLINYIVDDLMQDPNNFQGYSFYFSSQDQRFFFHFLRQDPTYLTHLELWKSDNYKNQMEYCSGKSLKEIEMGKFRNPMRQIHWMILRQKMVITEAFSKISIKNDHFSQSKLQFLIALLHKEVEISYCRHHKDSEKIAKSMSIPKLRDFQSNLIVAFEKFIQEDFHDLDPHRSGLVTRVIEIKIRLGSKLIKSELDYLKQRIAAFEENQNEIQDQVSHKKALEKEYSQALEKKYQDSYYFKMADLAIEKIGASPLVKLELMERLPAFCEKKILNLRNEKNINLSRNRLIELDKYLNELLQMKKLMAEDEFSSVYWRNKVREKSLEELAVILPEKVEDLNQKIAETIIEGKLSKLDQFRGEFTNKGFERLVKFLGDDKTCRRYFVILGRKRASEFFKEKLNPYDLVRGVQLEEIEEHTEADQTRKLEAWSKYKEKIGKCDSIPECAENYLTRLEAGVEFAQVEGSMPKKFEIEFEKLKKCLTTEGLISSEISELIEKAQKKIETKEWEATKGLFVQIFKKIRALDFQQIIDLVKEGANASEIMNGKPALAFIGKTGAGKSTAIQFLAGAKMTESQIGGVSDIQGTSHIRGLSSLKMAGIEGLERITTSANAASETRYVIPVMIRDYDISSLLNYGNENNEVVFCDTPGFGDTRSVEMDIANTSAVVTAIKKAKKVRPVVVISYKSLGDRSQGLRELVEQISRLRGQAQENPNFESFTYLFTKFPEAEKKTLVPMLKNLKAILQEDGADEVLINFIGDMLEKTESKRGSMLFEPLKVDRMEVIDNIAQVEPIEYPEEFFKISFTNPSIHRIEKQLSLHKDKIFAAVERHDFSYAHYLLNELKESYILLKYEPITEKYQEITEYLSKRFKAQYEEAKETLNRCLSSQNELLGSDVQQYQNSLNIAKLAETLINAHLNKKDIGVHLYEENVQIGAMSLVIEIQKKSLEKSNHALLKASLEKLRILANFFGIIQDQFRFACEDSKAKFNEARGKLEMSMKKQKYESFTTEFSHIRGAFDHLRVFLNIPESQIEDDKLKFLEMIKVDADSSEAAVKERKIEEKDILTQKNFLDRIHLLISSDEKKDGLNLDELKRIAAEFLEKICSTFDNRNNIVNKLFSNNSDNDFEIEEQYIQEMEWIRKIPLAEARTRDSYNKTQGVIIGKIQELSRDITTILSQNEVEDYSKVAANLIKIEKIKWIDKYMQGSPCRTCLEKAQKHTLAHLQEQKDFIVKNCRFDQDHYENNVKALHAVRKLKEFRSQILSVKEIQEIISKVEEECNKIILKSLMDMKNRIAVAVSDGYGFIDPSEMEGRYGYVELLASIGIHSEASVSSSFEPLKNYLTGYGKIIQDEIKQCFAGIKIVEEEELNKLAQNIVHRLEELEEFKENRPKIFSCLKKFKITEKFIEDLAAYWDELLDNFEDFLQKNKLQNIVNQLIIAKTLSKFDKHLKNKQFSTLLKQQKESFYTHIKKIYEDAKTALRNGEYSDLSNLLQCLTLGNDSIVAYYLNDAKKSLNKHARQIFKEAEDQVITIDRELPLQEVKLGAQKLNLLENLQNELKEFLIDPQQLHPDRLSKFLIDSASAYLRRLIGSQKVYNFVEFDRRSEHLLLVVRALGSWCPSEIKSKVHTLNTEREKMLEEAEKTYLSLRLDQYSFETSPKEIIENLFKASRVNDMYLETIGKMRKSIMIKFRETIKTEKDFKKCEGALHYVPDDLRDILKAEMKESK